MPSLKSDLLKGKIIIEVLKFIEHGEDVNKNEAKKLLKEFGGIYNVFPKKQHNQNLKNALYSFILNNEGYNVTINRLYHSL